MRQLVDRGVDALIICCSNPTALNETVKYAYDKGVPIFSMVGYVTSPYAVNSSTNFVVTGKKMGDWLVDADRQEGQRARRRGHSRHQHLRLARPRHQGSASPPPRRQDRRRRRGHVDRPGRAGGSAEMARQPSRRSRRRRRPVGRGARRAARARAIGPQDAAGRDRRRARRALLLAPSSEIRQRGDPGLAAGRRDGAGLEHHDAHDGGPGTEGPVGPGRLDEAQLSTKSPAALPEDCSENSDKWFAVGAEKWGGGRLSTPSSCVPPIRKPTSPDREARGQRRGSTRRAAKLRASAS